MEPPLFLFWHLQSFPSIPSLPCAFRPPPSFLSPRQCCSEITLENSFFFFSFYLFIILIRFYTSNCNTWRGCLAQPNWSHFNPYVMLYVSYLSSATSVYAFMLSTNSHMHTYDLMFLVYKFLINLNFSTSIYWLLQPLNTWTDLRNNETSTPLSFSMKSSAKKGIVTTTKFSW